MVKLTYNGVTYEADYAYIGEDYLTLKNEDDTIVVRFEGVTDFSDFELIEGEWELCDAAEDCQLVVYTNDNRYVPCGVTARSLCEAKEYLDEYGGSLSKTNDYVIEYGTSNGWTFRKWNSGIAECWKRLSLDDVAFDKQISELESWYTQTTSLRENFPSGLFKSAPVANIYVSRSEMSHLNIIQTNAISLSLISYSILRHGPATTSAQDGFTVHFSAHGYWK